MRTIRRKDTREGKTRNEHNEKGDSIQEADLTERHHGGVHRGEQMREEDGNVAEIKRREERKCIDMEAGAREVNQTKNLKEEI